MNINTGIYNLFDTIIPLHAFKKCNKLRNNNNKILKIFDKINKINIHLVFQETEAIGVLIHELFIFHIFILNVKLLIIQK